MSAFTKRIRRSLKYLLWDLYYFIKSFLFTLFREKKKLAVLYVYADSQKYPKAYRYLCRLIRRIRGFEVTIVKVDNLNESKEVTKEGYNVYDIGGDNSYWEFSGWRKGLTFLDETGIEADVVLFVNDSFLNRSKSGYDLNYYKLRINTFSLFGLKDEALGKIDYHDESEIFSGNDVSSWIRSNIFAIPKNVADKLDSTFIDDKTIGKIFPDTFYGSIFKNSELLNSNLKRFIESWIISRWAQSQHITPKNWDFIKSKLTAILNERLLTAKLREHNIKIIDIGENNQNNIVSTFVPYWPENPYQDELSKHLEAYGVKVEKETFLKSAFHHIIFRHYKPDILHLHWLPSFTGSIISLLRLIAFVTRLFVLRMLGLRIVWTIHNLLPHEVKYTKIDWFMRKIISRLTHVLIVHTGTAKKEIIETWHLKDDANIFIVPHGNYIDSYENKIDRTTARKQLGICNSKMVMLFLGAIRPYKGVLRLIDAFKVLRDKRTHLIIAGKPLNDDEFTSAIRRKIQGCDNIKFAPGFIPEDRIQVYMNASDIVVFPYQAVLTSGAVILAMSFGKPVIAPAIGCIPDVLDGEGSILYDPSERDGLLKGMRRALDGNLEKMGKHNLESAKQLRWESIAKKTHKIYRECLSR